tara:strand:- start:427 stop:534 length:108 start_codon:yes stop_codon:yes gene_type:complete
LDSIAKSTGDELGEQPIKKKDKASKIYFILKNYII